MVQHCIDCRGGINILCTGPIFGKHDDELITSQTEAATGSPATDKPLTLQVLLLQRLDQVPATQQSLQQPGQGPGDSSLKPLDHIRNAASDPADTTGSQGLFTGEAAVVGQESKPAGAFPVSKKDLVVALPADAAHVPVVAAGRQWRGMHSVSGKLRSCLQRMCLPIGRQWPGLPECHSIGCCCCLRLHGTKQKHCLQTFLTAYLSCCCLHQVQLGTLHAGHFWASV